MMRSFCVEVTVVFSFIILHAYPERNVIVFKSSCISSCDFIDTIKSKPACISAYTHIQYPLSVGFIAFMSLKHNTPQ